VATLTEIRTAIQQTLLDNIAGINVYRNFPGTVVAPAIGILPAPMDYLLTFGNSSTPWEFDLIVVVEGDDDTAQDPLDELIDAVGNRSIAQVLLANQTLGRSDCSLKKPLTMSNYGAKYKFGGDDLYVGATIRIGVVTTHS
jgi:hypothetical protein